MSKPPEVALVEARVLSAPRGLRATWARAREMALAHPTLFRGCDVALHRAGDRARFDALAARFPALRPERGDLTGSFDDSRVADELAAMRPGWRMVTLCARLDGAWPNPLATRPPGPPGLVASRVVDETWLWLSLPWTLRGSTAEVADVLAPLVEHVGAPTWSRFDHAPLEAPSARHRADLRALGDELSRRVKLSFADESGPSSPRDLSASFRRALAPLDFVVARRSEPRVCVLKRSTRHGNVASLAVDLAGIAPGPWSPAVDLTITGLAGEVRIPIAAGARVTSAATWATRLAAVVSALEEVERIDAGRIDELLGPAPEWLSRLESTLCTPMSRP